MAGDLRECCRTALIDGLSELEHFPDCGARAGDPQEDALFDLPDEPKRGGQHP